MGSYFPAFPVPIPTTVGGWFGNVTHAKVDSLGVDLTYTPYGDPDSLESKLFGPYVPELKYGLDPLWNVPDPAVYTINDAKGQIPENERGEPWNPDWPTVTYQDTYKGTPKPLTSGDVMDFKYQTTIDKRIIAIYNDTDTPLINAKVKIADQTLKGAVCEIMAFGYDFDGWYYNGLKEQYFGNTLFNKTDGTDYRPEYVKFYMAGDMGLEPSTANLNEELTIPYLGAAGSQDAWAFGIITRYLTTEEGNYAGTDNDYMVLSTESI